MTKMPSEVNNDQLLNRHRELHDQLQTSQEEHREYWQRTSRSKKEGNRARPDVEDDGRPR